MLNSFSDQALASLPARRHTTPTAATQGQMTSNFDTTHYTSILRRIANVIYILPPHCSASHEGSAGRARGGYIVMATLQCPYSCIAPMRSSQMLANMMLNRISCAAAMTQTKSTVRCCACLHRSLVSWHANPLCTQADATFIPETLNFTSLRLG